jgi:hypothetical protein
LRRSEARKDYACEGCVQFLDFDEKRRNGKHQKATCANEKNKNQCFCGECGGCNGCDELRNCGLCSEGSKNWPVVLKGCYTFGSPKVGDGSFARAFDANQKALVKKNKDNEDADDLDIRRWEADDGTTGAHGTME